MSTKHTPGPWKAAGELTKPGDFLIKQDISDGPCYHIGEVWNTNGNGENAANARLIAAAPELLDALRTLVQMTENVGEIERFLNGPARAAIAKATGENPNT